VTVTFYDASDDSVIGTDTLTSNGTATTSWSSLSGGANEWYAVAEDSSGQQSTSQTFDFEAPGDLYISNELNHTQLIDSATVQIEFYFRNGTGPAKIVTRTTSTGVVNMTGLPTDQPFIVVASADNFTDRRIFVQSLTETQRVYLLPESATSVPVTFNIEDYSGNFPQDDSVLLVQRGINGTWQTVLGDYFGANGQFPAEVQKGARYRLVLYNVETGQDRVVGTYTPLSAGAQTVSVSPSGDVEVEGLDPTVAIQPDINVVPAQNNTEFAVTVDQRSATVQNWSVSLEYVPEAGANQTLWSFASSANGGSASKTLDLTGKNGTLVMDVRFNAGGVVDSVSHTFRLQWAPDGFSYSLLGTLTSALPTLLPADDWEAFSTVFALVVTILATAALSYSTGTTSEMAGGAAVLMLAGWSMVGFIGYGVVFVSGVSWMGFAALRRGVI
jgi:hypothetical protein